MTTLSIYLYVVLILSIIGTVYEYGANDKWQLMTANGNPKALLSMLVNFLHQIFFIFVSSFLLFCVSEYITKKRTYTGLLHFCMFLLILMMTSWFIFNDRCIITLIQNKLDENSTERRFHHAFHFGSHTDDIAVQWSYKRAYLYINACVLFDLIIKRATTV